MLVQLRNLVIETQDVFALFTDEDLKQPKHWVYIRDRTFTVEADEMAALVEVLKPKVLLAKAAADGEGR